ncbi:MAG: ATP-dependent RecD-like DNA helicase [Stenotrophomonas maltophilia]|nr:MAG: ATP-dependent RecD-like DNA helicase [Stenotrophomonas maltophilia]
MGACVSDKEVAVLEAEGGFPCRSVAKTISMLDRGKLILNANNVLVLDEAGMLETRQTHTLLEYSRKAGSKVILQGDLMQLQSIGAGSGMALARSAISDAQLTEIRRQARPEHREMAAMFYEYDTSGRMVDLIKGERNRAATLAIGQHLLSNLNKLNAIDNYEVQQKAIDSLVCRYMEAKCPVDQRLALASTQADVLELNKGISQAMQSQGFVDCEGQAVDVVDSKGESRKLEMAKGDRVVFTKGDARGLNFVNGHSGIVVRVTKSMDEGHELVIRISSQEPEKDGRLVTVKTSDYKHLAHNYATTIHKAQGQGKEEIFHLAHSGMLDNHSSLVAFTRLTKGNYTMFTDADTLERLHERLGLERLKENATSRRVVSEKYTSSINAIEGLRNSIDGFLTSGSRNKLQTKQREKVSIFGLGS